MSAAHENERGTVALEFSSQGNRVTETIGSVPCGGKTSTYVTTREEQEANSYDVDSHIREVFQGGSVCWMDENGGSPESGLIDQA